MPFLTERQAREQFDVSLPDCTCLECFAEFQGNRGITITEEPGQDQLIKMNKYIDKMGVELEGGWHEQPQNLAYDGSVRVSDMQYLGESVSPPCSTMKALTKFMRDNYPDRVNSSCGLHVHFSFTSIAYYSMLMDQNFNKYFDAKYKAWAGKNLAGETLFWARFRDENQFCKNNWKPDAQVNSSGKGDHRYARWNFCYNLHRTAECRLLPCFGELETSLLAIRALKATVISYLRLASRRIEPETAQEDVIADEPDTNQTQTIRDEICV